MKYFKFIVLAMVISAASCKKETKETTQEIITENEIAGLQLVKSVDSANFSVEIYSESGTIKQGYNNLYFRVKNTANNSYVQPTSLVLSTEMDMGSMQHGSPVSAITKVANKQNLYTGFAIFQMASMQTDDWKIMVSAEIQQQNILFSTPVQVIATPKVTCQTITGSDSKKYVIAMVEPKNPTIGSNVISARIFEMVNMHQFNEVNDLQLQIDPRMPSMGNHGSPNNVTMQQINGSGEYKGNVSFSMTGYWKINLKLVDEQATVLKGEDVTPENLSSSLYFEVEF